MKSFYLIVLFISLGYSVYGCSCSVAPFCDYSESIADDQTAIAFKGSVKYWEQIGSFSVAVEYKVDKLYYGEIVTPESPFYAGQEYASTDSTVWVLSSLGEFCLRPLFDIPAILVLKFREGIDTTSFGYVPSICYNDYFPIYEDDTVIAKVWESVGLDTMSVADFENIILDDCFYFTTGLEEAPKEEAYINVFPQPSHDILHIETNLEESSMNILLYNNLGQMIKNVDSLTIQLSDLENGIYYVVIIADRKKYLKKIIKV